jgi:translation initiation factor IF-1
MAGAPIEVEGTVVELLPHAMVRVALGGQRQVVAHLSGGTRRNYVRVLVGDRVLVQLSPADLGRGRIVRRLQADGRTGS